MPALNPSDRGTLLSLGEQLVNTWQACRAIFASRTDRFSKHKLAGVGTVPRVEPVWEAAALETYNFRQPGARRSGVDATDDEVAVGNVSPTPYFGRNRIPIQTPKQVQPIDQHLRLVQSHFAETEWLAHAVRFGVPIAVDHAHSDSRRVAAGKQRIVQIR